MIDDVSEFLFEIILPAVLGLFFVVDALNIQNGPRTRREALILACLCFALCLVNLYWMTGSAMNVSPYPGASG